MSVFKYFMKIG